MQRDAWTTTYRRPASVPNAVRVSAGSSIAAAAPMLARQHKRAA